MKKTDAPPRAGREGSMDLSKLFLGALIGSGIGVAFAKGDTFIVAVLVAAAIINIIR